MGLDAELTGALEELFAIPSGEVRHRADDALLPQQAIGEGRDVAHMDAATDHYAPFGNRSQCSGHQLAHWREDNRGVEWFRRHLVGAARPPRTELPREILGRNRPVG